MVHKQPTPGGGVANGLGAGAQETKERGVLLLRGIVIIIIAIVIIVTMRCSLQMALTVTSKRLSDLLLL